MPQTKVTEFFSQRKRRIDSQPLKRQKLRNSGDIVVDYISVEEGVEKEPCSDKKSKKAAPLKRKSSRASVRQPIITNSFKNASKEEATNQAEVLSRARPKTRIAAEPPKLDNFNFNLSTVLPSDPDLVITEYGNVPSPHGTPTKRKPDTDLQASTAQKRKRKSITDSVLPTSPTITVESETQPDERSVRKKLDMVPKITNKPHQPDATLTSADSDDVKPASPACNSSNVQPNRTTGSQKKKDVKALLSKCGKLQELKACLKKVQEINKDIKSKKPKEKTLETETRGPVETETKAKSTRQSTPAYEKYRDLAEKVPSSLTLPYKYKLLEDMFRGTDTVISIMHNRLERCTFDKLKRAVQDMIRKNFEPKHLGQMKSVYPDCYELRQEKGLVESGVKSNKYQMTVEPVIDASEETAKRKDGRPVFSSNEILKRKERFRGRLFDIVKLHHQKFLESLNPPIAVDSKKLNRWHPKFLLDGVPDIKPADLPKPPEEPKERLSARDVLNKTLGKVPSRVELALKKVAEATEAAEKLKPIHKPSGHAPQKTNSGVVGAKANPTSGISTSLLERIRAKEALKVQADMLRDESTERELDMLGRLSDIIKILRSHFVTEKKAVILEDEVIVKLCDSYKSSISQTAVEKHVEYMLKTLPDWITRISVSTGKYIKINKQMELAALNARINRLLKEKKRALPSSLL